MVCNLDEPATLTGHPRPQRRFRDKQKIYACMKSGCHESSVDHFLDARSSDPFGPAAPDLPGAAVAPGLFF